MNGGQAQKANFKAVAIVRDSLGRIVVDEAIFYDKDKLDKLREEVLKNGSYAYSRDS